MCCWKQWEQYCNYKLFHWPIKYEFSVKYSVVLISLTVCLFLFVPVGKTEAYPLLVAQRPGGSLMSPVVLFSLISQIIVQTTVQVGGFYYVQSQPW